MTYLLCMNKYLLKMKGFMIHDTNNLVTDCVEVSLGGLGSGNDGNPCSSSTSFLGFKSTDGPLSKSTLI